MAELGFDASSYQSGAYSGGGGFTFGIAKLSEGIGFKDPAADRHMAAILAQPIVPGGYHFSRPDLNPGTAGAYAEADWFWRVATSYGGARGMLLANDLEVGGGALGQWRDDFNGRLAWRLGGYAPGWYTYWNFAETRALNYGTPYWCWLAWPDENGPLPGPNFSVAMQQYGLTAVPGLGGQVDANRFFGTVAQLRALTVGGATPASSRIPGGGKMTAAHPTIAGRFDAVLLDPSRPGPNGTAAVLHAWSTDNGKTWGYQDWTDPVGYFAPGSESCAWTFDGQLVITGIGGDGAFYLASSDINGPSKGWVRCLPGPFATQAPGATGPIGPPGPTYDDTALRAEVAATDVKAQRALDDLAAIAADAAK